MEETVPMRFTFKEWETIYDVLVAAEENWTPEDDGPEPEEYELISNRILHKLEDLVTESQAEDEFRGRW